MEARKKTGLLLMLLSLISAGCAAPYIHENAVLGLSTSEMMDSRFDQEALMFTLSLDMNPKPEPGSEETDLTETEKSEMDIF